MPRLSTDRVLSPCPIALRSASDMGKFWQIIPSIQLSQPKKDSTPRRTRICETGEAGQRIRLKIYASTSHGALFGDDLS